MSLLVAAPAPAANLAAQPPTEHPNLTVEAKVVYSLTSQDPQALRDKLIDAIPMMAAHYKQQKRGLRATIVVHGEAYRFVLKNLESTPYKDDAAAKKAQAEIRVALERLVRTYGVRIEVCAGRHEKAWARPGEPLPVRAPRCERLHRSHRLAASWPCAPLRRVVSTAAPPAHLACDSFNSGCRACFSAGNSRKSRARSPIQPHDGPRTMTHTCSRLVVATVGLACLGSARLAMACPDCAPIRAARAAILDDPDFWSYVLLTALPFVVVTLVAVWAHRMGRPGKINANMNSPTKYDGPIISAGIFMGVGLGGFVDGILLHQLLQWHNMVSSWIPPTDLVNMKVNMVWDGLFHTLTWIMTVVGLGLLWRAGRRPEVPWAGKTFLGALFLGWGLFNFVEGVIDHQILGVHHVHTGTNELAWDLGFLASGLAFLALGWGLIRAARRQY